MEYIFLSKMSDASELNLEPEQLQPRDNMVYDYSSQTPRWLNSGLIIGLRPANERRHYFVMTSLIDWAQT